jgi:hypothetical protein
MKKLLIVSALLAVSASTALAQSGVNLSWSECGGFGAHNVTFACNTSTGAGFGMVASFAAPGPLDAFLGMSGQLDLRSQTTQLPDWWSHGTGFCRGTTALSASFDFSTGVNCLDPWLGQAVGGYLYQVGGSPSPGGLAGPDRANLLVQCAIPLGTEGPLDADVEFYGVRFNITRAKTTGAGNCTGCTVPVCVVLNEIQLFQPDALNNNPKISTPLVSNFLTWQASPGVDCPAATPTHKSSWGQVKSLYR